MAPAARLAAIFAEGAALRLRVAEAMGPAILGVVEVVVACTGAGGRLFFCGNGGSAADALHLATEWQIRLRSGVERPSWPAMALGGDAGALSAAGNDYGFAEVFARPLAGLGQRGDVLFGITTSGRSRNVVRALAVARGMGITTVGFLGGDGGEAAALCDHPLIIPSTETARIQEMHITLGHAILELAEDRLLGR